MQNHTLEQAKHHHVQFLLGYLLGGGSLGRTCYNSTYLVGGYEITPAEYEEIYTTAEMQFNSHPRKNH